MLRERRYGLTDAVNINSVRRRSREQTSGMKMMVEDSKSRRVADRRAAHGKIGRDPHGGNKCHFPLVFKIRPAFGGISYWAFDMYVLRPAVAAAALLHALHFELRT